MIVIAKYTLMDLEDPNDAVLSIIEGLDKYEDRNKDFNYKIEWDSEAIRITTVKLNESAN